MDPAKYDLFDCKQLEATRKSLASQAAELEGLIAKAETGAGGSVVAEMAYRPDLAKVRASAHLADSLGARQMCRYQPILASTWSSAELVAWNKTKAGNPLSSRVDPVRLPPPTTAKQP